MVVCYLLEKVCYGWYTFSQNVYFVLSYCVLVINIIRFLRFDTYFLCKILAAIMTLYFYYINDISSCVLITRTIFFVDFLSIPGAESTWILSFIGTLTSR